MLNSSGQVLLWQESWQLHLPGWASSGKDKDSTSAKEEGFHAVVCVIRINI
jgi:hypothetical protein